MNASIFLWPAVLLQLAVIYFISRITINQLFVLLKSSVLISLIFLPGTVLHESAHFLTAVILLLKVKGMSLFPQSDGKTIRLGTVEYEKKDAVRGILVGIAPLFMGLGSFIIISYFHISPILAGYFIFIVSSTMFSSRQDIQDLIVVAPLAIILIAVFYIFNIRFDIILNESISYRLMTVIKEINLYLFFSIIIHISLIFLLKWINSLLNR